MEFNITDIFRISCRISDDPSSYMCLSQQKTINAHAPTVDDKDVKRYTFTEAMWEFTPSKAG